MAQQAQYLGTGKRKTSVARVILRPGDGKTWFNGRTLEDYFPRRVSAIWVAKRPRVLPSASTMYQSRETSPGFAL